MNEKILITGGLGYIGSHISLLLIEAGYDVIIVDNLSNSYRDMIDKIKTISGGELTFIECDILSSDLEDVFKSHGPFSSVIHLAGLKSVSESINNPNLYYTTNVKGAINLLRCMSKYKCNHIVFSSSATVYGNTDKQDVPLTEQSKINPTTPYGKSKVIIENILQNYCYVIDDFSAICLRYFNPIGGIIRETPKKNSSNLFPSINKILKGEEKILNIYSGYNTLDQTGVRDYIHVLDLGNSHIQALSQTGFKVYNIGTGKGYSTLEIISAYERVNKVDIPFKITGKRPGDVDEIYCNPKLAEKELKWKSTYTLDEMVED